MLNIMQLTSSSKPTPTKPRKQTWIGALLTITDLATGLE